MDRQLKIILLSVVLSIGITFFAFYSAGVDFNERSQSADLAIASILGMGVIGYILGVFITLFVSIKRHSVTTYY